MTVTAATIAAWGDFPPPAADSAEEALLDRVVAAVIEHVTDHYYVADELTEAQEQAVIMQSARLWSRRKSPDGIAAFDDMGAIRVTSLDRDVQMLLTPKFGFA